MKRITTRSIRAILPILALAILASVTAQPGNAAEHPNAILSKKEVKQLVKNANTPADHMKLAKHYNALAEKHQAEAAEHAALAAEYAKRPQGYSTKVPMMPNSVEHCRYYAEHCRKTAERMHVLAREHEDMAKAS